MRKAPRARPSPTSRPTLYQLCRAGERFEVGDGPVDLSDVDVMTIGRGDPVRMRSAHGHVLVDDPWMSSNHAKLTRVAPASDAQSAFLIEDLGSTNGITLNGVNTPSAALRHGDLIETGRTFWLYLEESAELPLLRTPTEFGTGTTWSPIFAAVLAQIEAATQSSVHMLFTGPEGGGKGFLIRTLHLRSRRSGRLVHLDCRERRAKRLAVDLFGSPAQQARLLDAQGGTLFLENIDALPATLQARLQQILVSRTFPAEDGTAPIALDVRVVASTQLDPRQAVERGVLRADLVRTLSECRVEIPGLPVRRADLGLLLDEFIARARAAQAISREACRALLMHPWELHIKSLSKVVEAAAVLASTSQSPSGDVGRIELAHLPAMMLGWVPAAVGVGDVEDEKRPPSFQYAPSAVFRVEPDAFLDDDLDRTDATAHPAVAMADVPSDGFLDAVADLADVVEAYDAMEATAPLAPAPSIAGAAANAGDPVVGDRLDHAASAAPLHKNVIERSYATAIDPQLILDALRRSRGNVSAAARYLGRPRAMLLRWMKEFQISPDEIR